MECAPICIRFLRQLVFQRAQVSPGRRRDRARLYADPAGVDCTSTAATLAKERELRTAAAMRVLTVFHDVIPLADEFYGRVVSDLVNDR